MIYPSNITGPQFKDSDLVNFIFDGSELTLPVPKLPTYEKGIDSLTSIKDFRAINTRDWQTDSFDNPCLKLVKQMWLFEDTSTLDDIAECIFDVGIMEIIPGTEQANDLLNKSYFKKMILDTMAIVLAHEEDEYPDDDSWPKVANQFNYQCINRPHLDWLQIQMCAVEGRKPSPLAFIPIDKRFILTVSFSMISLHYQGRENPYSDELIRKLEFELFDEYLQSIDLRYTDETLDTIRAASEGTIS